uniref:Succinate dehydrogenase assembly factor 3 n=1 Tax=Fibrocapsa japonica TaxID=94617 RepID=A0A6U1PVN7_9STRA|mmetsp:Transcript_6334/g.9614  ORF Transcript_6334/g.9614 Transcript_6334/m.9614 type:complete len:100 (+) Transcript_6334:176-475(+)
MANLAAIRLYRTILKEHKHRLPLEMRKLGDAYVKAEFRQHKNADSTRTQDFMQEWTAYVEYLRKGQHLRQMQETEVKSLDEEQRKALEQLKNEAHKSKK